ncbi:MAG TPA: hypothetical protein VK324_02205 [Tepidisphaeraceae bacterium]|nr:hypothetical protein [Tepidisphaeraceae bacterium]
MTQPYQPPPPPQFQQYQPAGYYGFPPGFGPDPAAPAKRAGVLSIVLGVLALLAGTCLGAVAFVPLDQMDAQTQRQFDRIQAELDRAGVTFQAMFLMMGLLAAAPGVALIVVGFLVRRGTRGVVVTALIMTGLLLLLIASATIAAVVEVARNPTAAIGLVVYLVPLGLLALQLVWLVQALRNTSLVAARRQQLAAAYWQQPPYGPATPYPGGYGQPYGHGYGPPPPPPPAESR